MVRQSSDSSFLLRLARTHGGFAWGWRTGKGRSSGAVGRINESEWPAQAEDPGQRSDRIGETGQVEAGRHQRSAYGKRQGPGNHANAQGTQQRVSASAA